MNKTRFFYIDTLGCAKNEYDSQILAAELLARGYTKTEDPVEADIMIVNTCGFIDAAKVESIDRIFDMARIKGQDKKLVVTGCLSQRYHEELLKDIPEVDIFTGVNDYDRLADIFDEMYSEDATPDKDQVNGAVEKELPYRERLFEDNSYSAVIKIAEGCNNTCSFCAIPKIRGPYRSKTIENVIREATEMSAKGVKELIVIAQDTSYYGKDLYGRAMLPELLHELCKVEGIEWIRIMYVYDDGITDELIQTIADEPKICNYIDIPIQHISDNVLTAMRRKSTKASIVDTIGRLREAVPDIHIRTTLLVGFPGETEEDFDELLEFIGNAKIQRLGAFAFSDEEGTLAFDMNGKIDEDTKEQRRNKVMELQSAISMEINEAKLGKEYEVIVDEAVDGGTYTGRTRYDAPEIDNEVTFTSGTSHVPGDFVRVRITGAYEYDLEGEEV